MFRRIGFVPLLLAFVCFAAPVRAQQSEAARSTANLGELRELSRFTLELAIQEIDECCDGRLEQADREAQRRWAYSFFSWVIYSAGSPDWERLDGGDRFDRQAVRIRADYIARFAVHPVRWLADHPVSGLLADAGDIDRARLCAEVSAYGTVEQRLRAAERRRQVRQREVEAEFQEAAAESEATRTVIEAELTAAASDGRLPDVIAAIAAARSDQFQLADRMSLRIKELQREFWDWEAAWVERSRTQELASKDQALALAQFQSTANAYNAEIMRLTDRVEELETGLEDLGLYRPEQLKTIERPAITRPSLSAP